MIDDAAGRPGGGQPNNVMLLGDVRSISGRLQTRNDGRTVVPVSCECMKALPHSETYQIYILRS